MGETVCLSTGRLDPEELPTMTNASWRLANWLSEYAELMLMLRSEAGKVYCAMAQMFELYLLHVFYTFSSLNLADVILPQQQQQVGCIALQACRPEVCLPSTLARSPLPQLSSSFITRHHPARIHRRQDNPQSIEAHSCYR